MLRTTTAAFLSLLALSTTAAGAAEWRVYVSPAGDDRADGSESRPVATPERAQVLVRQHSAKGDVTVILSDGLYAISRPLRFTAADGGQGGHSVRWRAARKGGATISGGRRVVGWRMFEAKRGIYVADVPAGRDSRQVYVNGIHAFRPEMEIPRSEIDFDGTGFRVKGDLLAFLDKPLVPGRMELETRGIWTNRYIPISSLQGGRGVLQDPAWYNSTANFDTVIDPSFAEFAKITIVNALELMGRHHVWGANDDQWFLDPAAGKLYLKPNAYTDINASTVVLPGVEVLLSVAGTPERPVTNLSFEGLRFSHTSWLGPSSPEGYAVMQAGAYVTGLPTRLPRAEFGKCAAGCPAFETKRELLNQIPAAVQVSAARNVRFTNNVFSQLGSVALGIGQDDGATIAGKGLAAQDIIIDRNRFAQLAGGAILIGGVRADAHHPSSDALVNRRITVTNNIISGVSKDYKDNPAILLTYVDGAEISHNDISDAPYDGIDIGWGWGHNDVGGTRGMAADWGTYRWRPRYDRPTTLRNITVAANYIHGVKKLYQDGGAIYNLSDSPGTRIVDNYVVDIGDGIGLYLDQGSSFVRLERNVVDTNGIWLTSNNGANLRAGEPGGVRLADGRYVSPRTTQNVATGNWHNSQRQSGFWYPELSNRAEGNTLIADKAWPEAARQVIARAGVQP